jgi:hypothetical protein
MLVFANRVSIAKHALKFIVPGNGGGKTLTFTGKRHRCRSKRPHQHPREDLSD